MRRRNFLRIAGLGTAAVVLPTISVYSTSFEQTTADLIMNQFSFLKLDMAGVRQFAADYCTAVDTNKTLYVRTKMRLYDLFKIDSDRSQLVRTITTLYLVSTDFFNNKMDESKIVRYKGLYNPYKTPCANPFSSLYYPVAVS